jgi:signal transduction histidine kinase
MGIYHIRSFITTAKRGGGVVDYYTTNPFTNATDLKVSWVTDVDGTWLIGAGRYIVPGPLVLRA